MLGAGARRLQPSLQAPAPDGLGCRHGLPAAGPAAGATLLPPGLRRCFSSTGEASSPDDYHWLMALVPGYRPVVEYCGGTEIGGGFLTGSLLQPACASTFSTPSMGGRRERRALGGLLRRRRGAA
jgi:hypothetical protein